MRTLLGRTRCLQLFTFFLDTGTVIIVLYCIFQGRGFAMVFVTGFRSSDSTLSGPANAFDFSVLIRTKTGECFFLFIGNVVLHIWFKPI